METFDASPYDRQCTTHHIRWLLANCQPHDHTWLAGLIHLIFGNHAEMWPKKWNNDVVIHIFDDENFASQKSSLFQRLNKKIVVVQNPKRYQDFTAMGIKTIYWPWVHWFLHLIPLRKMPVWPQKKNYGNVTFNFLNRRAHTGRFFLIEKFFTQWPHLLDHGYVTANDISHYRDHPRLYRDPDFMQWYRSDHVGLEQNQMIYLDTPCSVNVKNFYYVAERIPGQICLQIETADVKCEYMNVLTEKSLMPLVTHQIPIVISHHPGVIDLLRNQGFDMFDDVIDHSYDNEKHYYRRLELCIERNEKILSGQQPLPDLASRLINNQTFLLGQWMENTLQNLLEQISNFYGSIAK